MVEARVGDQEIPQKTPRIYLLLGSEGSGKSTHGRLLAKSLGLPFFSTGDTLRAIRDDESDQSQKAQEVRRMFSDKKYLDAKALQEIMVSYFMDPIMSNGVVIDGMMRTEEEAVNFPQFLKNVGMENAEVNVISLRIPGWLGVERISRRNRDAHDTSLSTVKRMSEYYGGLGTRMHKVREVVERFGGRFEIVDAKGTDEITAREFSDKNRQRHIAEVYEKIIQTL